MVGRFVAMMFLICLLTVQSGCGSSSQNAATGTDPTVSTTPVTVDVAGNVNKIQNLTTAGINLSFIGFGQSSPDTVKLAATDAIANVQGTILPFLNGGGNLSASAVQALVQDKVLSKFPSALQSGIELAAATLDAVLPEPTSDQVLTANELAYLKAFWTGVVNGSQQYLAGAPASRDFQKPKSTGKWFHRKP